MTLTELKQLYPLGCEIQLTADARSRGMRRAYSGTVGRVENYGSRTDLGGNELVYLGVRVKGVKKLLSAPPSLWERTGGDLPR